MDVKIMDVLNIENPEEKLFGVKIQLTTTRAIFLMKDNAVETFKIESDANKRIEEITEILKDKPELEYRFLKNQSIKGFTTND